LGVLLIRTQAHSAFKTTFYLQGFNLSALAMIKLALYLIVFGVTYVWLKRETYKLPQMGLIISLSAIAITPVLILAGREPSPFINTLLAWVIYPLFVIGMGLALGSWAKNFRIKKRVILSNFILGATVILPVFGSASTLIIDKLQINSQTKTLNKYQSKTILDQIGSQDLRIPISPQLKLQYSCPPITQSYPINVKCSEGKYDKNYALKDISDRGISVPRLKYIDVYIAKDNCKLNTFRVDCIPSDILKTWCVHRTEYAGHIWCANTLKSRLRYQRYASPHPDITEKDNKSWDFDQTLPKSKDINGLPVQIKCSRYVDKEITTQQKTPDGATNAQTRNRYCRLKYLIDTDVELVTKFYVNAPDTLLPQAREAYEASQSFWMKMKIAK